MLPQRAFPPVRQPIRASPPTGDNRPFTAQQTTLVETMKRRVNRPLRKIESIVTSALELLDDRVAMLGAIRHNSQQEKIKVTFRSLLTHT